MRTLTQSTGSFDQVNTFSVIVKFAMMEMTITASLEKDYEKVGDGVFWAMKKADVVKMGYTLADAKEQIRINNETPIAHGDIVMIEGEQYRADVKGNYSDCVIFEKV